MRKGPKHRLAGELPVVFLKEGKTFIAYTPALDLSSSGKTLQEARKNFAEVLDLFLEELVSNGTLDEFLMEMGWSKAHAKWQSPVAFQKSVVMPFKLPVVV